MKTNYKIYQPTVLLLVFELLPQFSEQLQVWSVLAEPTTKHSVHTSCLFWCIGGALDDPDNRLAAKPGKHSGLQAASVD